MKSQARLFLSVGGFLFALLSLWGTYWSLALQRYGCLVSVEVLGCRSQVGALSDGKMVEVRSMYRYKDGREEELVSRVDPVSVPEVGSRTSFYIYTGPIDRLTDIRIPGDWYYAWAPALLFFVSTCMCFGIRWSIPRNCSVLWWYILGSVLLTILFAIYQSDSFERILRISGYVSDQRHVLNVGE